MHPRTSPDMAAYVRLRRLHTHATIYEIGALATQQRPVLQLTVFWSRARVLALICRFPIAILCLNGRENTR
jgi:hypothetical protein